MATPDSFSKEQFHTEVDVDEQVGEGVQEEEGGINCGVVQRQGPRERLAKKGDLLRAVVDLGGVGEVEALSEQEHLAKAWEDKMVLE